jgi:hypothetical protein
VEGREEVVANEERWARPVGISALVAVAVFIASVVVVSSLSANGEAAGLRSVHEHGARITTSSILQGVAFLLLAPSLIYLFRAARARAPSMRFQFLPLVVLAPLALAVASFLNGVAANEAASTFAEGGGKSTLTKSEASTECRSERNEDAVSFSEEFGSGKGALSDCASEKQADDRAENALSETSLRSFSALLQLIGTLAFAFALGYSCFHAMRVGLLSRFWGALGIALGVAAILGLFIFALVWFFYFGLLATGWVPRGRPPAWAAGEAVPWPSPGESAAKALEDRPGVPRSEAEEMPDEGKSSSDSSQPSDDEADVSQEMPPPPRRKRKQRD